jgi:hypothetical protein
MECSRVKWSAVQRSGVKRLEEGVPVAQSGIGEQGGGMGKANEGVAFKFLPTKFRETVIARS